MLQTRVRSLIFGLTLPLEAARTIVSHPPLIVWSILPIGITLALYGYVITTLNGAAMGFVDAHFNSWGWNTQGFGAFLVHLLLRIILIIVGAVTFSFVASIAASPFNDFLAESTEKWALPPLARVHNRSFANKAKLIAIDLMKTIAATVATLVALLVSWVPVINVISFLIAFLLLTFQFISYPQTRRGLGVGEGAKFLLRHLFACAGFGATLSVLFAIPIVSCLSLPLAVVGGTLLVARAAGEKTHSLPPLR